MDMTVSNRDIVETTRKLIHKPTTGFSTLHKKGRMDLSVEKIILEPKFRELFARADLQAAYNSLKERGYPQLDQIEAP
ncbi:MAG: hypothetical protein FWB71_04325 [Defluviitaleaceae bacterium]|nr:hypothetical protein [Defluviitaleaceae bacterium]